MYEQQSHALLNRILDELAPELQKRDLRHFYTRLGANFYAIYSLFSRLYGGRDDMEAKLTALVEVMARKHSERSGELRTLDMAREADYNWFLSQEWVGMALYLDGFAGDLNGLGEHLPYLQELGVNLVHVLPIMECPEGASDGGYAVNNFRSLKPGAGTLEDLRRLAERMRQRNMLLTLDLVLKHTSDEHP
ncbi:MAG: alpha-amylase family glycosyl hydrolase, partial [Anaerolineae bacterium]